MWNRWIPGLTLLLALAGCASGGDAQLRAAIAELDAAEYAETQTCLSVQRYHRVEVLNERYVLFHGNDELWVNTLRNGCPGLNRGDRLEFTTAGNLLCSLDAAAVANRFLLWRRSGALCTLGRFHRLTEPQTMLVRESV